MKYAQSSFSQIDKIGNIGIRGFTTWKKIQWQNVTPRENRTQAASDSKSNTLLSTLTWHMLLRRSLNLCSCTTWRLDLDDLRRINRAWLYKEPKVSVTVRLLQVILSPCSDVSATSGLVRARLHLLRLRTFLPGSSGEGGSGYSGKIFHSC